MSIYLRAAKRVDSSKYLLASCVAITFMSNDRRELLKYSRVFKPRGWSMDDVWGYMWSEDAAVFAFCPVLALLFMHWITESEKPKPKS